jgi:predicted RNA binding protein YcfA (HicA-like mRNA interferase family)
MSIQNSKKMKYKEFHRLIDRNGWKFSHAEGSHYFYVKNGVLSPPVPYHGAKEIYEPLRRSIARQMGLR